MEYKSIAAAKEAGLQYKDLKLILEVAKTSAIKGAESLKKHYGELNMIRSKGRIGDLVTNADLATEEILLSYLLGH